jgi:putative Holliday junction resolvase
MRILAIDYGAQRTGIAISDQTGALASPLETIARVGTPAGMDALVAVIAREQPALVVVGNPRTAGGVQGAQARATSAFVGRLRKRIAVPVELEDERFTTAAATRLGQTPTVTGLDARAAAVLLQGLLDRRAVAS